MNIKINPKFLFPTQYWEVELKENIKELQNESYTIKKNDQEGVIKSNTGLNGCNGRFPVNEKVAEVLRNQSTGKKMFIKLFAEDSGVGQLNEIGGGTVKAWKKIYANWSKSIELPAERLGY